MRQIYQDGRSLFYADSKRRLPDWDFYQIKLPSASLATAEVFFDSGSSVTYELVPKLGQPPIATTLCDISDRHGRLVIRKSDGLDCARGLWYMLIPALITVFILWLITCAR